MNIEKTKTKLKTLTDKELKTLLSLIHDEMEERPEYLSNTKNTPNEQCNSLQHAFSQAWIH